MSYQTGYETIAQSMNGIITLSDGAGTIIQDGSITTTSLSLNNILATFLNQTCSLFNNVLTGVSINVGRFICITDNYIDSTGELILGYFSSSGITLGNPNGMNYVRSYYPAVSTFDVINYNYLTTTFYTNLLSLTNVWSGISNTFNNVIYVSTIQPLLTSLTIGSATSNVAIQCTEHFMIGQNASASSGGTIAGPVIELGTVSTVNYIDFHCQPSFANDYDCRIRADAGANGTNGQGSLSYSAGSISIEPTTGLTLGSSTLQNTLIRQTNSLLIGPNPASFNPAIGTMSGFGMRFMNDTEYCFIDMFSSGLTDAGSSSTIKSIGGTLLPNSGSLNLTSGTININPVSGLTLGSATLQNTLIRHIDSLLIGPNPATYNIATGTMSGLGMRFLNNGGYCLIDMFSSGLTDAYPSSRIQSSGGTTGINSGSLILTSGTIKIQSLSYTGFDIQPTDAALTANLFTTQTQTLNIGGLNVNINGPSNNLCVYGPYRHEFNVGSSYCWHDFHSCSTIGNTNDYDARLWSIGGTSGSAGTGDMNYIAGGHWFAGRINAGSGLSYTKGNLTSPSFTQTGSTTMNTVLGNGNAMTPVYQSFPVAFSSVPNLQLTTFTTNVSAAMGCISSFHSVDVNGFYICFYNARSTNAAAGAYGVHWSATGGY